MTKSDGKRKDILYQAQAILARRDHSEAEVRAKLSRKKFSPQDIEQAIEWLKSHHLLDDAQFAATYARTLMSSKPVGPRYIAAMLSRHGVPARYVEAAVAHVFQEFPERDAAQQAIAAWDRMHAGSRNRREKLYRFLLSRGFSTDIVSEVLAGA